MTAAAGLPWLPAAFLPWVNWGLGFLWRLHAPLGRTLSWDLARFRLARGLWTVAFL